MEGTLLPGKLLTLGEARCPQGGPGHMSEMVLAPPGQPPTKGGSPGDLGPLQELQRPRCARLARIPHPQTAAIE